MQVWSLDRVAKLYYLIMECENARLKKGISFRLRSPFAVLKVGVHLKAVFTPHKIGQMRLSLPRETFSWTCTRHSLVLVRSLFSSYNVIKLLFSFTTLTEVLNSWIS